MATTNSNTVVRDLYTIRLERDLIEQITKEAEKKGLGVKGHAQLSREALHKAFNYKPAAEVKEEKPAPAKKPATKPAAKAAAKPVAKKTAPAKKPAAKKVAKK